MSGPTRHSFELHRSDDDTDGSAVPAGKVPTTDGSHGWTYEDPGGVADILDLPTAETDTTLVLAPDGSGGVEFRAETGGGGGSGGYPLDSYTMDATYGDHFDGSSLSGVWTRRNFTSGAESYQQGPNGTYMRIAFSGRAVGDGYFMTAPAGDWTFAMAFVPRFYDGGARLFGLAVIDTNGTGVWTSDGNGTPNAVDLLQLTTYTSYGGSYVEAGYNGAAPNVSYLSASLAGLMQKVWLKLRKSGTSYFAAFSTDGELWGPESSALTWSGTVNRVGFIYGPLSSSTVTNGYVDMDWFSKI